MDIQDNTIFLEESVQLCVHCGLCCMGYFHEYAVINNNHDLILVYKMGARSSIDKNGRQIFSLPCPKYDNKCTVYPERPSVCENHQCELLKSVKDKRITLEKAKHISDEMKKLCTSLEKELDNLVPNKDTHCLRTRFKPLFASGDTAKKNNPHIFLNYAAYVVLKNRYFYHETNDYMQKID